MTPVIKDFEGYLSVGYGEQYWSDFNTKGSFEVNIPRRHQKVVSGILDEEGEDWDNIFLET